jgi:DNA-binding NtrC family response regulator
MNADSPSSLPARQPEGAGAPPAAPMHILVVDDEEIVRDSLKSWFEMEGYAVGTAASGKEALTRLAEHPWDLFILDVKMPGMDGLELQRRIKESFPRAVVIIMTAYASVDSAVTAMKEGAHDYISKPFDPDDLERVVRNALARRDLEEENRRLKDNIDSMRFDEVIGRSQQIREVLQLVRSVAQTDSTVLIRGESGTGKELVARAIHAHSRRRYMPIVIVNSGALPEGLAESELFGHERGAFTSAHYQRKGKFELGDGGTIFLDEVGDISAKTQVLLLRVLEDRRIQRVGGNRTIPVDFRMIAATNRDLEAMVAEGSFREHFLERYRKSMNRRPLQFSGAARERMLQYEWPGNVRELQNAIERAVVVARGETVEDDLLPLGGETTRPNGSRTLADAERQHVEEVLRQTAWNISQAARVLDIDRVTLYNKIRRYGLQRPSS